MVSNGYNNNINFQMADPGSESTGNMAVVMILSCENPLTKRLHRRRTADRILFI
jgi:hypothetical protein